MFHDEISMANFPDGVQLILIAATSPIRDYTINLYFGDITAHYKSSDWCNPVANASVITRGISPRIIMAIKNIKEDMYYKSGDITDSGRGSGQISYRFASRTHGYSLWWHVKNGLR
jgi:hypothetical protein